MKGGNSICLDFYNSLVIEEVQRMEDRFFYICRKGNYVKGLNADYSRVTIASTYTKGLTILELSRQATDEEQERHELVFLCRAESINDEALQSKIGRFV